MATTFPTTIDALTNPTATDSMATVDHADQHTDANDAIEALQAKVGVDSSAVATSLDYLVTNASSSDPGHVHTASAVTDFDTEVGNNATVAANTTHLSSDGSDHTFIDQSVVSGATPTFTGTNFSGIPATALPDAAADGSTKGVATFTAADFNATTGNISLDYANAQKATDTQAGFLTELATIAETDTGTDTTRAVTPDGLQGSIRNLKHLLISLVDSATDVAVDTSIGGDWIIPFAGTIIQDDTDVDYFAAYTDTAGTTGTMVVDVHLNGTTIMTTNKLDIETTEKDTTTAATQPDLTTTTVAAGDILTFDIDAVHTTAAKGLKVMITIRPD